MLRRNPKLTKLVTYFVITLALFASRADATSTPIQSKTCMEMLLAMQELYANPTIQLAYREIPDKAVEYVDDIPTARGRLHEIKRISWGWSTSHRTNKYDPQGNPQWPIYLFGQHAAQNLGFQEQGVMNDRMTIPSLEFLNATLDLVNKNLPPDFQVQLKFRPAQDTKMALTLYLNEFRDRGAIPMGQVRTDVEVAIHDLSFHFPSIILPNQVLQRSRDLTKKIVEFSEGLEAAFKGSRHEKIAKTLKTKIFFTWVRYLDEGTAMVMQSLYQIIQLPRGEINDQRIREIFTNPILVLLGRANVFAFDTIEVGNSGATYEGFFRTSSPYLGLTKVIQEAAGALTLLLRSENGTETERQNILAYQELMATDTYRQFEKDFLMRWAKEDPNFKINDLPSLADLCKHMQLKRTKIIEALEKLPAP